MTSIAPPRRSIVQTQSVQQQFALLTADREKLCQEREAANRERKRTESTISQLKTAQTTITNELRQAHATLGVESKKKQLLLQEKGRLETMLSKENRELQEAQNQLASLQRKEANDKMIFLKSMHEAQDELDGLLNSLQEARWKRLVSLETAGLAPHVDGLDEAVELLQEGTDKKRHEEDVQQKLLEELEEWRARAQKEQPAVNWKDLESVWEESDEHDKPVQMDLFYGGESTTAEGVSADDGAEDEAP